MFYIIKFSEQYNHYIKCINNDNNIYIHYFYGNGEDNYIGIILQEISNNNPTEMLEDDVIELVDTKILSLLNHVFSCKNINGLSGLTYPNPKLFNTYMGKTSVSQLLFTIEKSNTINNIYTYLYNCYKKLIYQFRKYMFREDVEFVNRVLEVIISSSKNINKRYIIQIVSQEYINSMIKANVIKKLYKVYQS